jgi:TPR repeat protein
MTLKIGRHVVAIGLVASLLCGSANALTSGPPSISKSSSSRAGEFTVQKGISDDDFQTSERLDTAYAMARKVVAQGDMANAIKALRLVAEAGHFLAMHDLALLLRQANTKESFAEAAIWYRRASEWRGIGFSGSQNNLGDMYETGEGLPKSGGDAIYWYTRSALQGEPTAYLSLGSCFAEGFGVRRDLVEAYFWLTLAVRELGAGSNQDAAAKQLKEIEKAMTASQVAEAKSKADQFKPYYQTKLKIGDPFERNTNEQSPGGAK